MRKYDMCVACCSKKFRRQEYSKKYNWKISSSSSLSSCSTSKKKKKTRRGSSVLVKKKMSFLMFVRQNEKLVVRRIVKGKLKRKFFIMRGRRSLWRSLKVPKPTRLSSLQSFLRLIFSLFFLAHFFSFSFFRTKATSVSAKVSSLLFAQSASPPFLLHDKFVRWILTDISLCLQKIQFWQHTRGEKSSIKTERVDPGLLVCASVCCDENY